MKKFQARQGDVYLERVAEIPAEAKRVKPGKRGFVLAEGEATGHAHTVSPEDVELLIHETEMYLRVNAPTKVVHEEHDPIGLDPGIYRIGRQREYGPTEIRRVAD